MAKFSKVIYLVGAYQLGFPIYSCMQGFYNNKLREENALGIKGTFLKEKLREIGIGKGDQNA